MEYQLNTTIELKSARFDFTWDTLTIEAEIKPSGNIAPPPVVRLNFAPTQRILELLKEELKNLIINELPKLQQKNEVLSNERA